MAEDRDWQGTTDGTTWMHRNLIRLMRFLPLRFFYVFVAVLVVPFYFLFAKGYRPIYHYFNKRLGYSPVKSFVFVYRNYRRFSQVILDRFYMMAGGRFDFEVENYHLYQELADEDPGFMILNAHVGNYELAGYTLVADKKRFNVLVFGGETEAVTENRNKMFAGTNIRMIPVRNDMSHLFELSNALDNGESVSFPSDRVLSGQRTIECTFLGTPTQFPMGPFALAVQRDIAVLCVNVMKVSAKKYKVYVSKLQKDGDTKKEQMASLARQFAGHLEEVLSQYPEQWFNYYEFWND